MDFVVFAIRSNESAGALDLPLLLSYWNRGRRLHYFKHTTTFLAAKDRLSIHIWGLYLMPKLSQADRTSRVSANEARRRKEVALAELRELELAQRKGKLIDADQVASHWAAAGGKIRDAVLRIPDKCAAAVIAATDATEARGILLAECEAILRTLHDDLAQSA